MKILLSLSLGALAAFAGLRPVTAQTPASPQHDPRIGHLLDALGQVKHVSATALSPDAQSITWDVSGAGLSLAPLSSPASARPLTACRSGEKGQDFDAVFSPDSRHVAFFSECTPTHKTGIFLADVSGAASPRLLAQLDGVAQDLHWSPNGKQLSFLYVQ